MRKMWTEEEKRKFKKLYPITPQEEITRIFGRSESSVESLASKMKIKKLIRADGLRIFTEKEIKKIQKLLSKYPIERVSEMVARDSGDISSLAKKRNLSTVKNDFWWTDDEIFNLEKMYPNGSKEEIIKTIGKNWAAIKRRANVLGIKRINKITGMPYEKPVPLSDIEKKYILENHTVFTPHQIASKMGRSFEIVSSFLSERNILGVRIRKSPSSYSDEMLLSELIKMYDELGRRPTRAEISSNNVLPSCDIFYDRFGGLDNAFLLAGIDEVSGGMYGRSCRSKNGDVCLSAEEQKITNFFIDNNILYEKEKLYSDILKTNKKIRMDWFVNESIVVEYFGLMFMDSYYKKAMEKIELCNRNNIKIIPIYDTSNLSVDMFISK